MEQFIQDFGYWAVLIGTFLEGETILVLGGFAAHRGYLSLPVVIIVAFLGTVIGDQLFFYLGRKHSPSILKRRPGWQRKIEKAQRLINRHEILILLGFRFIYGLRAVIPFTLGLAAISPRVFVPLNIMGAIIWAVAIGSAGYYFGHALEVFLGHLKQFELWIMAGIVFSGVVVWLMYYRNRKP